MSDRKEETIKDRVDRLEKTVFKGKKIPPIEKDEGEEEDEE